MDPPSIEVENLTKVFLPRRSDPIRALDGISFQVKPGEVFGLLGPNGAGKSTLVRILATITRPTSGVARVRGFDVVHRPLETRRQIAVVLQETAVEMLLSVRDNLLIYGRLHFQPPRLLRERMNFVLDRFELREKQFERVNDLSVGMRRRLQVAKVFMVDSPILFLDEATTGMDPLIKRETLAFIREQAHAGRTIFLSTQALNEAEALCDRIAILDRGRIIASGDLETLRSLSSRMFRISLTFPEVTPPVRECLRGWNPLSMQVDGNRVELAFQGEESQILLRLAEVYQICPIQRFEVHDADLEDIFVELLKPRSAERSPA